MISYMTAYCLVGTDYVVCDLPLFRPTQRSIDLTKIITIE
jgi:hypothetical protein